MKRCFRCGTERSLDEFYTHPGMADGHLNKCKECTKEDTRMRVERMKEDPKWVESEKERTRLKYHRLGCKKPEAERKRETMYRYWTKYPEKRAARKSSLPRKKGYHNHHWSYRQEHVKDTILLTIDDHMKLHRFLIYDQDHFLYRNLDGVLLDTKEKHNDYANEVLTEK